MAETAVDFYLKIDGVDGESDKTGVENQIEVIEWNWGQTNKGTMAHGGGGSAGKVNMRDFHFTMTINKATPKLMLMCATAEHIKKAVLTCREGTGAGGMQPYLVVTFSDVVLSGYDISSEAGRDGKPVDKVWFNYSKIEWEYKKQKQDGTLEAPIQAGYDLKKLTKV